MDYFLKIKRNELGRYARWREDHGRQAPADEPSDWEQNEYFDFF